MDRRQEHRVVEVEHVSLPHHGERAFDERWSERCRLAVYEHEVVSQGAYYVSHAPQDAPQHPADLAHGMTRSVEDRVRGVVDERRNGQFDTDRAQVGDVLLDTQ